MFIKVDQIQSSGQTSLYSGFPGGAHQHTLLLVGAASVCGRLPGVAEVLTRDDSSTGCLELFPFTDLMYIPLNLKNI